MLGKTIHSHYTIVKFLGMGRSGEAYLAKDIDLPHRPICLVKKVRLSAANSSPQISPERLFDWYGETIDRLGQHPQIPSLMARFMEGRGMYLVREYIDGEPVSKELTGGSKWTQTQAFDFLFDLVGVLGFIHSFNYIHQDINPDNIIRRSNDGRFMLVGLSSIKDLANTANYIPDITRQDANISIGTPGYIPYEQEQNCSQFTSDIYAVGVVAIQALTGEFPIPRDPRTYELDWRDRVSHINLRLVNIIDKMVRPDYRNRYQSTAEIFKDLQAFALTQIPPSKFDRLKPHLIFGSAACALLLGFTGMKLMSASADKSPTNNAIESPQKSPTPNSTPTNVAKSGWQSYRNPDTGIKIKYYPTWQLLENNNLLTGEKVIFVSPQQSESDKYLEHVALRVETLANPQISLAEYTTLVTKEINKFYKRAKIIETTSISLAKNPANLLVFTGEDETGLTVKILEVFTVKNGRAYTITYKADSKQYYAFLQTVMTMINSFEIAAKTPI
jgi:serine/threonine-protein kinase